ncbi:hypothetical protein C3747_139g86 [Trypanosoma cruzi]|uniref:Polycystin cation channel PKD1/PKD2 domain-containing protein n=2 Tax=Trypanosoma cruzi TaxID=5693 RepID=Q4CZG2_TRYCC|nr:hypothetical protein, conserved [Trypanosoma cruzi]EAN85664.1 hypothetical protein, conserved [Trypanosoma cruzi]PWV05002.1 hypothetical protein C3747_139g86 [Trypanosoma cruzi]RNC48983.1 hypothetical protein TcCL_NonESM01056 [Trypanosoma cruzi]|eukprot:XP_807515.1 hypothetical protein [Trypanosoma cruzi strain CL Brener]
MHGDFSQHLRHARFPFGNTPVTREMTENGGVVLQNADVASSGPCHGPPREPPPPPPPPSQANGGKTQAFLALFSRHHDFNTRGCKSEHHRLINEDFFTDPIRKLLRDGNFPFKLVVNCLMLLFLILIAVMFHAPENIANEEQRKAVLHSFVGNDYIGKDKGNIKFRPTVYLHKREDVLKDIKEFVKVYYALANISVSELHYYYYVVSEDGAAALRRLMESETPEGSDCFEAIVHGNVHDLDDAGDLVNLMCVLPVSMEVDAYLYSQREYRGPSPLRHFSVQLTEKDPLGPFSDDREGSSTDNRDHRAAHSDRDKYVESVCAPRYDEITGLYYRPCREAPDTSENGTSHGTDGENDGFVFPLMDNVYRIRLKASIRHLTDTFFNRQEATSGFETVIYHWVIEKVFSFHAGGLVEVEFMISVKTRRICPFAHPRFFFSVALLLLAVFDIVLRYRALRRIATSRKRVAVPQPTLREEDSLVPLPQERSSEFSTHAVAYSTGSNASLGAQGDSTTSHASPILYRRSPRSRKPVTRKVKHVPRAGSLVPETVYTDFYDAWREHLQTSRGESWHYIAIVADTLGVAYVFTTSVRLWGISTPEFCDTLESIFLGLTGLLLSVNLLSYIRYFPQMYFAVRAMRRVIPRLLGFAMSVAPIFFGFALFFCIVFGPHSNGEFSDMGFSLVALYFVMFGDAILPAIEDAEGSVYLIVTVLANFMTMLFILFFMMTMLNLAMSITQHEWGLLRRRFGSCLSANNLLFEVRTRDEVKTEAMEVVIANMELILHIKSEERLTADAAHERHGEENGSSGCASDTVEGLSRSPRDLQRGDVADMYRRRLDELTEGILNEDE